MTEQVYYLKEEVYLEPLIQNWFAWPYMIPPVSCAMIFSERITKLMKSFVKNHKLHIAASSNKKLAGGDFVNCRPEQVADVQALLDTIEHDYQDYFTIRQGLTELNQYLEENAKGFALELDYPKIPTILRGYVELVYNENHNGFVRFIEGLLYHSPLYKPQAQSISLGLLSKVGERPFVLSTPRLADENHLHIDVRFAEPLLDQLVELRQTPQTKAQINRWLEGKKLSGGLTFDDLLTTASPATGYCGIEQDLRIRFVGHAGLCIEADGLTVLVDPVLPSRTTEQADDFYSFSDLPDKIDYICVTHTHMDHVCLETLLQLRYKTEVILVPKNNGGTITDPSLKLMLKTLGFNVIEMEDMEVIAVPQGIIRAIPFLGEHADLNIRSKTAWMFELKGKKLFVAADSSNLDECMYQNIQRVVGDVDMLFIGMECVGAPMSWLYGSLFTKPIPRDINQSRRFNGADYNTAKRLVEIFKPSHVYVYALGLEPYFGYFMGLSYGDDSQQIIESDKLLDFCQQQNIVCERLAGSRVWHL